MLCVFDGYAAQAKRLYERYDVRQLRAYIAWLIVELLLRRLV
jgi:hypothetical protein